MQKVFFDGELGKVCGILETVDNKNEIVILIHGFSSTKDTSAKTHARILNKLWINTLRIDLDNQWESELDFKTWICIPNYIKQVEASIKFVKKNWYKKISLLGTSLGGIVALSTAITHPEIKRIFLRAPVLDNQRHLIRKYWKEKIEEFRKKWKITHTNRDWDIFSYTFKHYETAKDFSMFDHAPNLKQEIMIVQWDKDKSVDYKVAIELVNKFPNAKLHIIKWADHKLSVNGNFDEWKKVMKQFFRNQSTKDNL